MFQNDYQRELDQLGPGPQELERLSAILNGEQTAVKPVFKLGRRAAAALAMCAALLLTAAAAGPTLWYALLGWLGPFAPYAQEIEGVSCTDQGIELRVMGAMADDVQGWVYLSVRDLEGDRLNERLHLNGSLKALDSDSLAASRGGSLQALSYDPESKTVLLSGRFSVEEGDQTLRYSASRLTTQECTADASVSCAGVTAEILDSRPAASQDRVVFRPSDVVGSQYGDAILPEQQVVLIPGQTPMPLEGMEDMQVSSMGFASDGCFHIRLDYAPGVDDAFSLGTGAFFCQLDTLDSSSFTEERFWRCLETRVEDGLDILFPLVTVEDAGNLKQVRFYGEYQVDGVEITGQWALDFQVEHLSSVPLAWTGTLAGRQVTSAALSPLTVTISADDTGAFSTASLTALLSDGSAVTANPMSIGSHYSLVPGQTYRSRNVWAFETPVDLEQVTALELLGEQIPVVFAPSP